MTSRKHHCLTKNTRSEAKYSEVALSSNTFSLYVFSPRVCLSLSPCASVFSVCLFGAHTDTVFQTAPSSKTSNPTLFSARMKEKEKHTRFHLNIHQQQPHKTQTKKKQKTKKNKTQKHKHSDAQTDGDMAQTWTHTRTRACRYLPDTHHILTDKHTKKQQTQSTAQPEVYFMQKYSKVCFTIQLNIKGWYIPLWSLTPQWTNPTHPHPLTAYRESCWTSPLITR